MKEQKMTDEQLSQELNKSKGGLADKPDRLFGSSCKRYAYWFSRFILPQLPQY